MEEYDEKIAVLERCAAETPVVGTEEYNLINGPLGVFKNYIDGVIENEQNRNNSYDEQSKQALENIYSIVHTSDSNISSHDRVEICKTIATLVSCKMRFAESTTKETTKRMEIAAKHNTLMKVGEVAEKVIMVAVPLVQQYLDYKNKPWWKKMLGR